MPAQRSVSGHRAADPMRLLFLSHTADTGIFRVGSHHLSRELAKRGHLVVHASTPVTPAHLARVQDPDLRRRVRRTLAGPWRDDDGVLHVVTRAPWPPSTGPHWMRAIAARACARTLDAALTRHGFRDFDVALIDKPGLSPIIPYLRAKRLIYRATDSHPDARSRRHVTRLMSAVDAAVATSTGVLETLGPRTTRMPTLVLENGVEFERFQASPGPGTGAVYVGALDYRFDWATLAGMAENYPDVPFRLVGPANDVPRALPTNVQLIGPVPYDSIPGVLASAAVGLLPLTDSSVNLGRSPMKYFEYLAAGLYVVASETPALRSQPAPGALLYRTQQDAIEALQTQLSRTGRNAAGIEAASDFDWAKRAEILERFIARL